MAFTAITIILFTINIQVAAINYQVAANGIFKHCLRTTFDYENEIESCFRAWGLIKPIICVDRGITNNRTLMFCPVSP